MHSPWGVFKLWPSGLFKQNKQHSHCQQFPGYRGFCVVQPGLRRTWKYALLTFLVGFPCFHVQVVYVTSCLQYGHLKSAARAVKDLGLQQEFPDVESAYKRKTVDKLAAKGLWGVAATYVGDDPVLQVRCA